MTTLLYLPTYLYINCGFSNFDVDNSECRTVNQCVTPTNVGEFPEKYKEKRKESLHHSEIGIGIYGREYIMGLITRTYKNGLTLCKRNREILKLFFISLLVSWYIVCTCILLKV